MRKVHTKEKIFMGVLAITVIGSAFWMSYTILSGKVTPNDKLTFFIMGYIMGQSERVLNYYFGSSKGSSDKTDIILRGRYREHYEPKEDNYRSEQPNNYSSQRIGGNNE